MSGKLRAKTLILVTAVMGLFSGLLLSGSPITLRAIAGGLAEWADSAKWIVVTSVLAVGLWQLCRQARGRARVSPVRLSTRKAWARVLARVPAISAPGRLRRMGAYVQEYGLRTVPTKMQAMALGVIIAVVGIGLSHGFVPWRVNAAPLNVRQLTFTGGNNSILRTYGSIGLQFGLSSDTTLTLGATFSEVMGLEPLVILRQSRKIDPEWTLNWTLSRGDFGGDYRVERVPEITFGHGGELGSLGYNVSVGVGYFLVRPVGLDGVRWVADVQLATRTLPLGSFATLSASTGYHQAAYSGGALNGAWWGNTQLNINPEGSLTTLFTYFRQSASGSSPLLFDNVGPDEYVSGLASLKLGESVIARHGITYSIISQTMSARVSTVTVTFGGGQGASISWDAVPQKFSVSYSRSDLGTLSIGYEMPTRFISLWYQRR